jgi:hypothetical protein
MNKKIQLLPVLMLMAFRIQAQTTLPTWWNFSSPGIASPPSGWSYNLTISNGNLIYIGSTNSVGGDNISCRLDATGEYVQVWFADKPGSVSYWIKGSGISPAPAFSGIFKVQESVDGINWMDVHIFNNTDLTGTMTRFSDNLQLTSRYARFYYTSKQTGSNVALDSVMVQTSPPPSTPSINIKQGTTTVINGGQYIVGKAAATTFTIENKGTQDTLVITNSSIAGTEASDYSITGMPAKIAAGNSASFTLNFNPPGSNASRYATLTVNSNDADKSMYKINLYGISGNYASEPDILVGPLQFSSVKAYGFKASFNNPSPVKPEGYLVLCKRGSPVFESPVDGQTYMKGDYIGAAQVALAGIDTFFLPTYILGGNEYYFKIYPYNGPNGFQNYFAAGSLPNYSIRVPQGNPGTYYNGINSASSDFLVKLHNKINPHDTVFYSQYIAKIVNPFLKRDTTGGKKVVNCVYTGIPYVYDEPFLWWSGANSGILTREHTFAQSWMPTDAQLPGNPELPEYNDVHNLFPADQANANGKRSNYPFGEIVGTPTYTSPSGYGKLGKDVNNNTVWEPRDEQKGDLARAIFYMLTCYNGVNGNNWRMPATQSETLLKKWHFQDLPDAIEKSRQELIYDLQRNRNPFIDSPNFACRINFSNMIWNSTLSTPCGIPQLTVLNPAKGVEDVRDIGMLPIQWAALNVDSIKIYYIVNDTGVHLITPGIAATTGFFNWVIGSSNGDSLQIRIESKTDSTVFAVSPKFVLLQTLGVQPLNRLNISVYPNPSTDIFTVNLNGEKNVICQLYDMRGALLQTQIGVSGKVLMSTGGKKGIFILMVHSENGIQAKKIISE